MDDSAVGPGCCRAAGDGRVEVRRYRPVQGVERAERRNCDSKKTSAPTSLVGLIFENALSETDLQKLGADQTASIELLKQAVGTISKSSPAEAAGYGKFLVDVATAVAEASKESGLLGLGGTRVSAEEKRAIDQIKSVAGLATCSSGN